MSDTRDLNADVERTERHGLKVARDLATFVEDEALPGTCVDPAVFWKGFAELVESFTPQNPALLEIREELKRRMDK